MAEEAGGQEEADRVMAVPPLGQRILHAGEGRIGLRADQLTGSDRLLTRCSIAIVRMKAR